MRFTVNRESGKAKMGGKGQVEGSIDCVASLGEAGKGDADTRMSSKQKRDRGWEMIWGAVKKEGE